MADQPRRALDALTSSDVGRLLAHHSLDRYAPSFESLSGADLREANDTDLEELGVKVEPPPAAARSRRVRVGRRA